MKYHFTPTRTAIVNKDKISKVGKNVENWNLVCVGWECKMAQPLGERAWQFLKKLNRFTYHTTSDSTPRYLPKRNQVCSQKMCMQMFTAPLLTICNSPEVETLFVKIPTDKWTNKMSISIHSMSSPTGCSTIQFWC